MAGLAATAFVADLLFNRRHKARMDALGKRLGVHAFEDFQGLFRRVAHHKAVGALVHVLLELDQLHGIQRFFQVAAELS